MKIAILSDSIKGLMYHWNYTEIKVLNCQKDKGTRPGSVVFFWVCDGLTFKGFQRQKCKSDRCIYNIFCHKSSCFKDKSRYCGYYFQARNEYPKNSQEWLDPENWSYVITRKIRPNHRLISHDNDEIKKNLDLRIGRQMAR